MNNCCFIGDATLECWRTMVEQVRSHRMRILMIVLGVAIVSLLAIQLGSRRQGNRSTERVAPADEVPSLARRDYPSSFQAQPSFAGRPEAPAQSAHGNPADLLGPESNLTPEQVTRRHVSRQM